MTDYEQIIPVFLLAFTIYLQFSFHVTCTYFLNILYIMLQNEQYHHRGEPGSIPSQSIWNMVNKVAIGQVFPLSTTFNVSIITTALKSHSFTCHRRHVSLTHDSIVKQHTQNCCL